jgi:acetyltransferase-like isoleucine patch superfamily enzyme
MFLILLARKIIDRLKVFYILHYQYPRNSNLNKIKSLVPVNLKKIGNNVSTDTDIDFGPFLEEVGHGVYLGKRTYIGYCKKIGNYSSISNDVKIGMLAHPLNYISTSPMFYAKRRGWVQQDIYDEQQNGYVEIGSDVLISANVIVLAGVKIGHGAVIGAGAVVNKDIPPYAIAVGVPAKVIKYRFTDEIVTSLLKSKWWEKDEHLLKKYVQHATDPVAFITAIVNESV